MLIIFNTSFLIGCRWQGLKLFHSYTSPHHTDIDCNFEEITSATGLPLSRFDLKDGDEIHFEVTEDNIRIQLCI